MTPTSEIARFEILGVLGSGAHGVVVLAHDHADASLEPVGLKVLKGADRESVARLQEEARILGWLCHPNIVKVHRLLEKDGVPIVVMEHVAGASAEQIVRPRVGLPASVAVEIARRAATALEAAWDAPGPDGHPMRIVHRDIQPANLLVSIAGEVKLVDFGFAARERAPRDRGLLGTPGFVAPERRNGGPESTEVDVYGLGATLYTMLTGMALVPPTAVADHDPWVARAVAQLPCDPLLRDLIVDMCRFHADQRPGTAELVRRLDRASALLGRADLRAYADQNVAPILQARARAGSSWSEVAFLERAGTVRDLGLETPEPPRRLALRSVQPPADVGPLLRKLGRHTRWPFRKDPAKLVDALVGLRGTRDPHVVTRAYELTGHPDPRVAEAAWELLASAC